MNFNDPQDIMILFLAVTFILGFILVKASGDL